MSDGEMKPCPLCDGLQLSVPKCVRERMRKLFFDAEEKVDRGQMSEEELENVKDQLEEQLVGYPDCSFCEGSGLVPVTDRDRDYDGPDCGEEWKRGSA